MNGSHPFTCWPTGAQLALHVLLEVGHNQGLLFLLPLGFVRVEEALVVGGFFPESFEGGQVDEVAHPLLKFLFFANATAFAAVAGLRPLPA